MTKCKLCRKQIDDGTEYCDDCAKKKDLATNESYLDELLNSVQSQGTTASDIYKKKKENQRDDSPEIVAPQNEPEPSLIDPLDIEDFEVYDIMKEFDDPIVISEEDLDKANNQPDANVDDEFLKDNELNEQGLIDDEYIEPALEDLLKHLDMTEDDINDNANVANGDDISDEAAVNETNSSLSQVPDMADIDSLIASLNLGDSNNSADNEKFDLLNGINTDNQEVDDIKAISDLLGVKDVESIPSKKYPEDIGEVFSKTLEAVSDLSDIDPDIPVIVPDIDYFNEKDDKGKKDKKEHKDKKRRKEKKEKKQGLFAKLFANIEDEDEVKEKKKAKEQVSGAKDGKKKKKKKSSKELPVANTDEIEEIPVRGRRQAEPQEEENKNKKEKKKKKKKKEKKEKKEKKKIEILDDYVDEGKINKAGASIVFVFFGLLVMLILISTNIFSYSLSIKNATDYFERQKYTKAYNEVYGMELKDEDIELYDKIMTVMFVNKQLNSYNSYYQMKKYPEALDSLLKGLQRYDKYIELATMLGIETDLEYVREQIIAELYNVFSITEEQALKIINSENQTEYSIAIYDVVLENVLFYN